MLGQLGMMALGVVDLLVIAGEGDVALAAVGLGNTWSFASLVFGLGLVIGMSPLLTQGYGARQLDAVGSAVLHGGILASVCAVGILIVHLLAEPGMATLGQPALVVPHAAQYVHVVSLSIVPFLGFAWVRELLQADGEMATATWVILLGNLVNLLADLYLVRVVQASVAGVAWATVVVRWAMFLLLLWRARGAFAAVLPGTRFTYAALRQVGRIAFPVAWQIGFEVWAFNATMFMAGWLGTSALAAHTAALNMTSIAFMAPLGMASAATTRVGNQVGASQDWRRAGLTSIVLGALCMVGSGTLFAFTPEWLAGFYAHDAEGIQRIAGVLPIAAVYGVFDGVQVVSLGVLRGLGDTRFGAGVALFAYWGLTLPLAALGSMWMGLPGLWWAICAGLATSATLLSARLIVYAIRGPRGLHPTPNG